ncbi:MAG: hypothetical protein PUB22_08475 [Clostridiales bacterium]|nr:hypothetical protein [Clostridiales bacterium]
MSNKNEIKAIVYTSNTGHTKEYAELLGKKVGITVLDLQKANRDIPAGSAILYMGWLMAGQVKGFKSAQKKFNIKAVCGVGMAKTGSQVEDIRKTNGVLESVPVFSLQGGFEMEKLHGVYKFMMSFMKRMIEKRQRGNNQPTPEETEMFELLKISENMVKEEYLKELIDWLEN